MSGRGTTPWPATPERQMVTLELAVILALLLVMLAVHLTAEALLAQRPALLLAGFSMLPALLLVVWLAWMSRRSSSSRTRRAR